MTWRLRSGRIAEVERYEMGEIFLHSFEGHMVPHTHSVDNGPVTIFNNKELRCGRLVYEERRELANAAIEAWNRWAETGKL